MRRHFCFINRVTAYVLNQPVCYYSPKFQVSQLDATRFRSLQVSFSLFLTLRAGSETACFSLIFKIIFIWKCIINISHKNSKLYILKSIHLFYFKLKTFLNLSYSILTAMSNCLLDNSHVPVRLCSRTPCIVTMNSCVKY